MINLLLTRIKAPTSKPPLDARRTQHPAGTIHTVQVCVVASLTRLFHRTCVDIVASRVWPPRSSHNIHRLDRRPLFITV